MKLKLLAATILAAASLAACQPPASTETPAAEESAAAGEATTETPVAAAPEAAPAQLPCGVIDQRNWSAVYTAGARATLTVAGQIDLGTPGYGVSLSRDPGEAAGATTANLTLSLRAPSGMQAQVVTPHSVNYFGPAGGAYTSVRITCDGATLTEINVTR